MPSLLPIASLIRKHVTALHSVNYDYPHHYQVQIFTPGWQVWTHVLTKGVSVRLGFLPALDPLIESEV